MDLRYLVSSKEMKRYDSVTMEHFGVPGCVLMERAALSVAEEVEKLFTVKKKVLIVAGCGNNGGDGIAIGRILMQRGYFVEIVLIGEKSRCSEETKKQIHIIEKYGCLLQSKIEGKEYDIIIDALFGIGLSRPVEGICKETIEKINKMGTFVCAVDIPSGINADTGEVMGAAVKADSTVTFAFEKLGHICYPGCEYAGNVIVRDIGITKESFLDKAPYVYSYKKAGNGMLPKRKAGGNKGTFGKALVVAGSITMSGACELCARSAYRMGAGMVKIVTPEENREIVQRNLPEALLRVYSSDIGESDKLRQMREGLFSDMEWADCIVVGPGLGKSKAAHDIVRMVVTETDKPLVMDADGINMIADDIELKAYLEKEKKKERSMILTPHILEFARLFGCTAAEAKKNILVYPKELAERFGCTVVCKDARTAVAVCGMERIYLNTTGNDGMATAGSGDVLTGIIGGLLAQGLKAEDAAVYGVYIHGLTGDMAADKMGRHAVMAGDLTEQLKYIGAEEGKGK